MLRAVSFVLALSVVAAASTQAAPAFAQQAAAPPSVPTQTKPSELVTPALVAVGNAGSAVDLNKWRGSAAVKQDVDGNLGSIQKDLQGTLPPLLKTADASPASVSASIPVLLNIDALYNVLLRVSISGKAGAPRDQQESIDGALSTLDRARRDLGERIARIASGQEKQLAALQTALQQQAASITTMQQAAAAAATPPAPAPKPKKKKPAPKPAATTTPATPAKPAQ